jgi:hypothetical protein
MEHQDGTPEIADTEAYEAPIVAPLTLEEGTVFTAAGVAGSID